ncbi:hypothetical protein [Dysgonomonas sp. ZJ709]|uniref:hypothetical protein n=1 Tax=Dysgonomonas sp. ZJ709 TaxID=2709797 RepID=UPI0013EB7284|nr:hypothetical protein [Dysgonomonas sp. ZJ709]
MRTHLFLILFTISTLGILFTSCGSDDDYVPDLTMYDNSVLQGKYNGTCKVDLIDIKRPTENLNTTMYLKNTSDAKVLYMITDEFGLIDSGDKVRNFKYTSLDKTACIFTIGAFGNTDRVGSNIPEYITKWFSDDFDKINKVDLNLNQTTANYTFATETLTYTLKGTLKLYVEIGSESFEKTNEIQYTYSVVKQ